jgi:hypothetical protein
VDNSNKFVNIFAFRRIPFLSIPVSIPGNGSIPSPEWQFGRVIPQE